jgi:hypothetical protein
MKKKNPQEFVRNVLKTKVTNSNLVTLNLFKPTISCHSILFCCSASYWSTSE